MATVTAKVVPRLKQRYDDEIRPELVKRFGYTSPMQAPRLEKITLNMGVGEAKTDTRMLESATEQLATIAGQRPNVRRARKSIAGFKIRDGMPIGVAVTLRGARMYEFLDRLNAIAIPRIRDFRGLNPRSFDGRGNYSIGIREQIIFPEIDYDSIDQVRGLDVVITTTAATDAEAFALLEAFGMPFRREGVPPGWASGDGAAADAPAAEAVEEAPVEQAAEEGRSVEEARAKAEAEAAAREQLREEQAEEHETPSGPAEKGEAGAHEEPGGAAGVAADDAGASVEPAEEERPGSETEAQGGDQSGEES
jgi:large subunit ribosomal protein L5